MTGRALALRLKLGGGTCLIVLACLLFAEPSTFGQSVAEPGASVDTKVSGYDVVSIKVNKSGSGNVDITSKLTTYSGFNVPFKTLVQHAYRMREDLIYGLSGPVASARFDVEAKIVDTDLDALKKLTPDQQGALLRPMLEDRFELKVHKETRVLQAYELVIAKGGSKFKEASIANSTGMGEGTRIQNGVLTAHAVSLASLADSLSHQLHQTVLDRTGLTGKFDLKLSWRSEYGPGASAEDSASSIFAGLPEQLGLKLRSVKGPVEILVIDHVAMPSEN